VIRVLSVLGALPVIALGLLSVLGARHDVGVVVSGGGPNAFLGAAWVACWLATVVVTPIAAGAVLLTLVLERLLHSACR
jgi:hypothetical protein